MNENLEDKLRELLGDKKYFLVMEPESGAAMSVFLNGGIKDLVFFHKIVDIALNQRIEKGKE
jgi:hypothetical protein